MSRIAKNTIKISKETSCTFEKGVFLAKGKLGEMSVSVNSNFEIKINDEDIQVIPKDNKLKKDPNWGTTRALINNMVIGVTTGFTKNLEIVGVGYRGAVSGKKLTLNLGLSHSVEIEIPDDIEVKMDGNTKLSLTSANKQKLGQFCSVIRSKRPPEPFKGKGIRYSDEYVIRKEGKKK